MAVMRGASYPAPEGDRKRRDLATLLARFRVEASSDVFCPDRPPPALKPSYPALTGSKLAAGPTSHQGNLPYLEQNDAKRKAVFRVQRDKEIDL